MFDRPPRRFWRGGRVLALGRLDRERGPPLGWKPGCEKARDDIEAAAVCSSGFDRVRGQPGVRAAPQSTLLALIDRLGRSAVFAGAPTLDLDENEQTSAARDQVDLDAICPDVASNNAIPSGLEESGGSSFALASEPLAVIRRVATHGWALICRTR
jgi:hypothetical protein